MKIKSKLLIATTACGIAFGAATPAYAATTDDTTAALLLRLKDKGILTQEEYDGLMERKKTEVAQTPDWEKERGSFVKMKETGVGMQLGPVAVTFAGSVNGFYTHDSGATPSATTTVAGGLATVGRSSSSVRNGLLPGFLTIGVTTTQGGWDVGAHFGMYPGINSNSGVGGANSGGSPQALQTSGIDFRQTYMTFGRKGFGEVKIGRDIGLFGSDAILNDITLLAVGTAAGNSAPSNTSLGRIGLGYIYTDFQPQITYTSPKMGGFQVAAGAFQPLNTIGSTEVNKTPGFQGKLTYDGKFGGVGLHSWLGGITQKHDATGLLPAYTGNGVDVGTKLSIGPAALTGYYYTGKGIGTIGLFLLSTDSLGRPRHSDGYYVQGTVAFNKLTLGASYGKSSIDLTNAEEADRARTPLARLGIYNPILLRSNSSFVGQIRYGLTSWVTLISEYTHTLSRATGGNRANSDAVAAGGILFF